MTNRNEGSAMRPLPGVRLPEGWMFPQVSPHDNRKTVVRPRRSLRRTAKRGHTVHIFERNVESVNRYQNIGSWAGEQRVK